MEKPKLRSLQNRDFGKQVGLRVSFKTTIGSSFVLHGRHVYEGERDGRNKQQTWGNEECIQNLVEKPEIGQTVENTWGLTGRQY